jgi:hypothetical protein
MSHHFNYEVIGVTGDGQTFNAKGMLTGEQGNFLGVPEAALKAAFNMLTKGETEYGQPGKSGCRGPYTINKMVIERYTGPTIPVERPEGESLQ